MIHNFIIEILLIVENQRDVVFTRNVSGRNDREFVPRDRSVSAACDGGWLLERDRLDSPARDRAAHSHAVQHPFELQIVDVERRAGNFLAAFFAGDCFANGGHWTNYEYNIPKSKQTLYTYRRRKLLGFAHPSQ